MIRPTVRGLARRSFACVALFAAGGAGCSSTAVPSTGVIELDLEHEDPRFRIHAAARAVAEDRTDLVPALVERLSDPDPAVRMFAGAALRKLTGKDFDFSPHGSAAEREAAVERWRAWLEARAEADEGLAGGTSAGEERGS